MNKIPESVIPIRLALAFKNEQIYFQVNSMPLSPGHQNVCVWMRVTGFKNGIA